MTSEARDFRRDLSKAARHVAARWWLLLLAAVVVGTGSYVMAARSAEPSVYALINTRLVSPLSNDRIDLMKDIEVAMSQPSVLEGPAEVHGLSTNELAQALSAQRVETTTLERVRFTGDGFTDPERRKILEDVVASVSAFISGQSNTADDPITSGPVQAALARETAAREAVSQAIVANEGQSPTLELASLQDSGAPAKRLQRAAVQARRFQELQSQLNMAVAATKKYQELAIESQFSTGQPVELPLSFQGADREAGGQSTHLRRALAGGIAGALAAGVFLVGASLRSGRRP